MNLDIRTLREGDPAGWRQWLTDIDEPAQDRSIVLVAWEGLNAVGALWGKPTHHGFRVDGLAGRDQSVTDTLVQALSATNEKERVLDASLDIDDTSACNSLLRAGWSERAIDILVERDLDDISVTSDDPFTYRSITEVGQESLVAIMARCATGPGFVAQEQFAEMRFSAGESYRPELWSVVWHQGREVGVLLLGAYLYEPDCGCIVYMGLAPEERRGGLGAGLHRAAMARLKQNGFRRYVDATNVDNAAMRRVFEANGCRETGRLRMLRREPKSAAAFVDTSAGIRPNDDPAVARLIKWLLAHGASFPKLAVEHRTREGRGVYLREPADAGEVLLHVPAHLIMTREMANESPVGRALLDAPGEPPSEDQILSAYLLAERANPESFFGPYLDALPVAFPSNPLFFDEQELAYLEGSLLIEQIEQRRKSFRTEYESIQSRVPEIGFTEADYVWARLIVTCRNFGFTKDDVKTRGLVPFADLLNHKHPPEIGWTYADDADGFVMTASAALGAWAPVRDSYGEKCNRRYLLNYGFTLEDNPHDEARIVLRLSAHDQWLAFKQKQLGLAPDCLEETILLTRDPSSAEARRALAFVRMACADTTDLGQGTAFEGGTPISAGNEARALAALRHACEDAMSRFPTTIKEDEHLLASNTQTINARNAVVMRRGEKLVLRHWRNLLDACIPFLDWSWPKLSVHAQQPGAFDPYDAFVRENVIKAVESDPWRALAEHAERGPSLAKQATLTFEAIA